MNLKIVGADCSNGIKLLKNIKKVEKELNNSLNIQLILVKDKEKYNVKDIPTLFIDDKIVSSSKVLSDKELYKLLKPITT